MFIKLELGISVSSGMHTCHIMFAYAVIFYCTICTVVYIHVEYYRNSVISPLSTMGMVLSYQSVLKSSFGMLGGQISVTCVYIF